MRFGLIAAFALLLASCGRSEEAAEPPVSPAPGIASSPPSASAQPPGADSGNAPPGARASMTPPSEGAAGACLMQGEEPLRVMPVRAVGTEPFWGARIAGRCVTYSTPEDRHGTRLWTRYSEGPEGAVWSGRFGGMPFQLHVRAAPGCSDGMSDKRYPLAVELMVAGEARRGCAEPI